MPRSFLKQIQRDAYLVSRAAGDLDAASRGPKPLVKRVVRRRATRGFFRTLRQVRRAMR